MEVEHSLETRNRERRGDGAAVVLSAAGNRGNDGHNVTVRERGVVTIEKPYVFVIHVYIDDATKSAFLRDEKPPEFVVTFEHGFHGFLNRRCVDVDRFSIIYVASKNTWNQNCDRHLLAPFAAQQRGRDLF